MCSSDLHTDVTSDRRFLNKFVNAGRYVCSDAETASCASRFHLHAVLTCTYIYCTVCIMWTHGRVNILKQRERIYQS